MGLGGIVSNRSASQMTRGSLVRAMFEEGRRLKAEKGAENIHDFTLGNPSNEPPSALIQRMAALLMDPQTGTHRYMSNPGYEGVRDAIAAWICRRDSLPVPLSREHVIMSCGAAGAINVALKAVLDPGDEVVVPRPYFVEYDFYVDNHGGVTIPVDTDENFMPDLEKMETAITARTKVILINSPNNPTGIVYPESFLMALEALITRCEEKYGHPILLLSDEPYAGLVYDGTKVPSVLRNVRHSVVAMSHSKDLGLAGERIGYLALSPRIEEAKALFDACVLHTRTLGFVNAPALIQRVVAEFQGQVSGLADYQARRDLLYRELTAMGFEMVKPGGAFYLFPKSPVPDDAVFVEEALKHDLLVVPGKAFAGPGHFRISFAERTIADIERALPVFNAVATHFGLRG